MEGEAHVQPGGDRQFAGGAEIQDKPYLEIEEWVVPASASRQWEPSAGGNGRAEQDAGNLPVELEDAHAEQVDAVFGASEKRVAGDPARRDLHLETAVLAEGRARA